MSKLNALMEIVNIHLQKINLAIQINVILFKNTALRWVYLFPTLIFSHLVL